MAGLSFRRVCGLLAATLYTAVFVHGQVIDPAIIYTFKSRPDLYPPKLNVSTNEPGVTPGYIFMGPYQTIQNSIAIYTNAGQLVWTGFGVTGFGNAHDIRVCQFNSSDHLCFYQGYQYLGYARGQGVIMDNTFTTVHTVHGQNGLPGVDMHEFTVKDGSVYTTIYEPMRYDLTAFNITDGQGWILDSAFQETNETTGELLFEWRASEHVPLSEGYVGMGASEVSGSGFNATSPWDYFHINSVDRNGDGDFLISARHTSALYKISGQDGHIIWRCGGKASDFELQQGLNWSYQHHARWRSTNASTDIISLFDNASNGFDASANHSAGLIIKLDHSANPPTASLIARFDAPPEIPISASQGNVQLLAGNENWASSNALLGWGSQPYVTEHDATGKIIYQANVGATGMMNYRAYKYNFTSNPVESPALYTYAQSNTSNTQFYMSWNGATEVRQWRVYGKGGCDADWNVLGTVDWADFETVYEASGYQEFGLVEALAGDGTRLRNSSARGIRAFVPGPALSSACNGTDCNVASSYNTDAGIASNPATETVGVCAFQSATRSSSGAGASSTDDNKHNAATAQRPDGMLLGAAAAVAVLLTAVVGA